jgi:phage baseplate assembly protein W
MTLLLTGGMGIAPSGGGGGPPASPTPAPPSTVRFSSLLGADQADFGSDVSTFPGLDPSFQLQTGSRVLMEALARRLMTPRGTLPFAEDYGTDVRAWLSEGIEGADLDDLKAAVEQELLKDERVDDVQVVVEWVPQEERLTIRAAVDTAEGPFRLVLGVTELTVALLQPEET